MWRTPARSEAPGFERARSRQQTNPATSAQSPSWRLLYPGVKNLALYRGVKNLARTSYSKGKVGLSTFRLVGAAMAIQAALARRRALVVQIPGGAGPDIHAWPWRQPSGLRLPGTKRVSVVGSAITSANCSGRMTRTRRKQQPKLPGRPQYLCRHHEAPGPELPMHPGANASPANRSSQRSMMALSSRLIRTRHVNSSSGSQASHWFFHHAGKLRPIRYLGSADASQFEKLRPVKYWSVLIWTSWMSAWLEPGL